MILRRANRTDVPEMLSLKEELSLEPRMTSLEPANPPTLSHGGFLLGSTVSEYEARIDQGICWVLEHRKKVAGFAIILTDALLRSSEIFAKRHGLKWSVNSKPIDNARLSYYDQLAVRPGPARKQVPLLSLIALLEVLEQGTEHILSTNVIYPVHNQAAEPYLQTVGAQIVGSFEEEVPGIGCMVSNVWAVSAQGCNTRLHELSKGPLKEVFVKAKEVLSVSNH